MIVKKLAVPFINDKLLQQVEHAYIATAALSLAGFDFIRSRIPPKSKIEIVTGLDVPTSPEVLRKVFRNYHERIALTIYTRNFFHANVYIFDLPYRKAVAFVGSGHTTLEGIKDGEELFYKVTDAKEIESLKSWFTGYYEFAQPLTEELIREYEWLYPTLKQRDSQSRQEKEQLLALTTAGFSWEHIKLKNQYFKKEDYLVFSTSKSHVNTPELLAERMQVQTKLMQLHEQIKNRVHQLKLHESAEPETIVSSLDPAQHTNRQLRSMWLSYGRSAADLKKISASTTLADVMHVQIILRQKDLGIRLVAGTPHTGEVDREYFKNKMHDEEYRKQFLKLLQGLGAGYCIDVGGEQKPVDVFQTEDALWAFTQADQWLHFDFTIGINYASEGVGISNENIADTMLKELEKLAVLYHYMKKA
jgi:hypothetical protein